MTVTVSQLRLRFEKARAERNKVSIKKPRSIKKSVDLSTKEKALLEVKRLNAVVYRLRRKLKDKQEEVDRLKFTNGRVSGHSSPGRDGPFMGY